MLTMTLKGLLAHKLRMFSTAFAVLIGVAFMAGTLVFTDTLGATFDDVLSEANTGVDAMVRAPEAVSLDFGSVGDRIDGATVSRVLAVDGVDDAVARVSGYAQLIGPDGDPVGDQAQAPAFGLNWVDNPALNPYRLVAGSAPVDGEIVVDRGSASTAGLDVGDRVQVLTKAEPREFTIAGIASFGSADSAAGASAVLFSLANAEELLSEPGRIDGVAVTAEPGVSQTQLVNSLTTVLGKDLEIITGDQQVAEDQAAFDEAFGPFKIFLLVFAGVAIFVGAFIINNTFSITVAQRSKEMAMLRAIGASGAQVRRSVLVEAFVTGALASGVGIVAGIGVARGLRALLSASGIDLPDGPMVIGTSSMAVAFGVGLLVTVASAVMPARRAARIAPIAALRAIAVDRSGASMARAVMGVLVTAAGAGLLLLGVGGAGMAAVGVGAVVSFVGVAVLGPILARPVSAALGFPMRVTGVTAELATNNATRSPKRTARTASALMIGVGLVAFITVFGASLKTSFSGSLATDFHGTHVVDSGVFDARGGLSPQLAQALSEADGVELISETRVGPALIDGAPSTLQGFTAATIGQFFDLGTIEGDLAGLGQDGIAVEAGLAAENGWSLGSVIPVTLPSGESTFTVGAIYGGSEWVGSSFVDIGAFDRALPGSLDARVYVMGDDAAVRSAAEAYPTGKVLDKQEFFDQASAQVDQMLGVVYAMLALAVGIALLGIANTLALSVFERTRELGLLRAVGMTRRQVRATVRGEAVIVALFGTLLGLVIGAFFGWAAVRGLADQGIDTLTFPTGRLLVIAALGGLAGMAAAVLPARRAARLHVLTALASS